MVVYFRKDISSLIVNKKLIFLITVCSLPVIITGYLLVKFNLIDEIRNIKVIGYMTVIFGILLFISDRFNTEKNIKSHLTYKSGLIIGLLQVLALIPGVSRSGVTLSAVRFLNFNRHDSAKISFLLSIPTLGAVSIFGINNLLDSTDFSFSLVMLASVFLSFIFSYITIKYFLRYLKSYNLNIFVIYRVILGILLLWMAYL